LNHRNTDWKLPDDIGSWERVNTALLMDIREELRVLNRRLSCPDFIAIPRTLKAIKLNTTKPKKKPKLKVVKRKAA